LAGEGIRPLGLVVGAVVRFISKLANPAIAFTLWPLLWPLIQAGQAFMALDLAPGCKIGSNGQTPLPLHA
jgi:hypothetical protein